MKHLMQSLMGLVTVLAVVVDATAAPAGGERAPADTKHAATASAVANERASKATTTTQRGLDRILGNARVPAWSPVVRPQLFDPRPGRPGMTCTATGCDEKPEKCREEGQVCSGCIMDACYPAY